MQTNISMLALLSVLLFAVIASFIQAQFRTVPFWDPTLHGITPEMKHEFDLAISKGDYRRAEAIRAKVGEEIVNAFWAGVNVRQLRPVMEMWNMDFKGKR